ncbi:MAG: hypothetical protein HY392_00535 [Candidatus Diapherotrites archaeon]|nr:hypothetical protein [Candidatus Diapherotrites archaeon]
MKNIFSRVEGKPVFRIIEKGGMSIDAHAFKVRNPSKYGRLFKNGEKVLYIHFDITDQDAAKSALEKLGKKYPQLKKQGFSGIFGGSQNYAVLRQFQKMANRLGLKSASRDTPFLAGIGARLRYQQNVREKKYPAKHSANKPRRLAIRFSD